MAVNRGPSLCRRVTGSIRSDASGADAFLDMRDASITRPGTMTHRMWGTIVRTKLALAVAGSVTAPLALGLLTAPAANSSVEPVTLVEAAVAKIWGPKLRLAATDPSAKAWVRWCGAQRTQFGPGSASHVFRAKNKHQELNLKQKRYDSAARAKEVVRKHKRKVWSCGEQVGPRWAYSNSVDAFKNDVFSRSYTRTYKRKIIDSRSIIYRKGKTVSFLYYQRKRSGTFTGYKTLVKSKDLSRLNRTARKLELARWR